MRRLTLMVLIGAALMAGLSACGKKGPQGTEEPAKPQGAPAGSYAGPGIECYNPSQTKCPVTGEGIRGDYYYEHDNGRIYFSSQDALKKFKENPDKYMDKLKEGG